ncbi:hypothetical protein T439DRAFT_252986 [Meredithblackwellia eburnea MCA 4105]
MARARRIRMTIGHKALRGLGEAVVVTVVGGSGSRANRIAVIRSFWNLAFSVCTYPYAARGYGPTGLSPELRLDLARIDFLRMLSPALSSVRSASAFANSESLYKTTIIAVIIDHKND